MAFNPLLDQWEEVLPILTDPRSNCRRWLLLRVAQELLIEVAGVESGLCSMKSGDLLVGIDWEEPVDVGAWRL